MLRIFSALSGRFREGFVQVLIPLLGSCLLLFGVIVLGKAAADRLRSRDTHTPAPVVVGGALIPSGDQQPTASSVADNDSSIAFEDVVCIPPPPRDCAGFLGEVKFYPQMSSRLRLLDPGLQMRLQAAFARHPWVEQVKKVEIDARQVRVYLVYRTPVLTVKLADGTRVVDGNAVLLPPSAGANQALPILRSKVAPTTALAGKPCGDVDVQAAARTAGFLYPYQDRLEVAEIEVKSEGLVLTLSSKVRVVWGRAPNAELADEASTDQKLQRLLEYCKKSGVLAAPRSEVYDVRPPLGAVRTALPR